MGFGEVVSFSLSSIAHLYTSFFHDFFINTSFSLPVTLHSFSLNKQTNKKTSRHISGYNAFLSRLQAQDFIPCGYWIIENHCVDINLLLWAFENNSFSIFSFLFLSFFFFLLELIYNFLTITAGQQSDPVIILHHVPSQVTR